MDLVGGDDWDLGKEWSLTTMWCVKGLSFTNIIQLIDAKHVLMFVINQCGAHIGWLQRQEESRLGQ